MEPVVGDKYLVSVEQLGKPTHRQDIEVAGLGVVVLDEADVHYCQQHPEGAFFVRLSMALGGRFVVVSRVQPA
jgi:3-mercaptopyruvate sulfurtransferase SseA